MSFIDIYGIVEIQHTGMFVVLFCFTPACLSLYISLISLSTSSFYPALQLYHLPVRIPFCVIYYITINTHCQALHAFLYASLQRLTSV